jgi:autotransporter-associated beta strand protein
MLYLAFAFGAQGASLTWDADTGTTGAQDGSGTWTTGAGGWWNGSANVNFAASDIPTFGAGADLTNTITVGSAITCGTPLTFANSGYTLSAASTKVITFGGTVTVASGKTATVSTNVELTRSAGAFTLNGPGTLNISGTGSKFGTTAGTASTIGSGATVNVLNGGLLFCGNSIQMSGVSGGSTVIVDGGSVAVAGSAGSMIVNSSGSGSATLTLTNGATVSTVSTTTGGLRFGSSTTTGWGVLNLDGGTLTTARIFENISSILSTNNFNGGTLKALSGTTQNASFLTGLDRANVRNGGAIIDPNGQIITISQDLLHSDISGDSATDGGVTIIGTGGTLILTGANTYTGPTTINGSKFGVTPPYNTLGSAVVVNNNGRLKVSSTTSSSELPALTLNDGGGIEFDLGVFNPANAPGISNANLTVSGTNIIDISGGAIPVTSITLLTYTNKTGTGTFELGALAPGLEATLTDTGSALVLNVTSASANLLVWSAGSGNWDFVSANWNSGANVYAEPAVVTFPSSAAGSVNVSTDVNPKSITVDASSSGYNFSGVGGIGGATSFSKTGTSFITLSSSNNYPGITAISTGSIVAAADSALGNPVGGTTVALGTSLALSGVNYSTAEPLAITGPGVTSSHFFSGSGTQRGALQSISGNNLWAGDIIVIPNSNNRIGVQDGSQLTLTGNIAESTNAVNLIFRLGNTAGSDITVSGTSNHWTGSTSIYGGGDAALHLGTNNTLPKASILVVGIGGIGGNVYLDLNGFNQEVAGLSGDAIGIITDNGSQPSTLTLNPTNNDQIYPGVIQDGANSVSIIKNGSWTQIFSGNSSYTGPTIVNAGSLRILGSLGATPVTVNTNAYLDGTGMIGGPVTINPGGTLIAGGGSIGTLTINNNLTLLGNLQFKLDKSLAQSNDTVNVSGVLANTGTGTVFINNIGVDPLVPGDSFKLFSQPVANGHALTISGPAGVTFTNNLEVDGSITVVPGTANYPTNISYSVTGNTLSLAWPATHLGWYAQSNSVNLADTNYWFDVANSQNGTNLTITIDPTQTNVFYRLRQP